jgi:hypothetical protein
MTVQKIRESVNTDSTSVVVTMNFHGKITTEIIVPHVTPEVNVSKEKMTMDWFFYYNRGAAYKVIGIVCIYYGS